MIRTCAGAGRGSFNHRFAQPSRDGHRYSAFFYPTDLFPFSSVTQTDAVSERTQGLFANEAHLPKVFSTNTGYEYWGRAASLLHTTPDGARDVEPHASERIYHLRSGQHFVSAFPPRSRTQISQGVWRGNPLDFLVTERALLTCLIEWVDGDVRPPDSAFPRLANDELVAVDALEFPRVPGVRAPLVVHEAYRADYGPLWPLGIVAYQPPHLGAAFPALVARVDEFGNEVTGVATLETLVPLATYTPWSLRTGLAGEQHELADFRGQFVPLSRAADERAERGDSRPSIAELYESREDYLERAQAAVDELLDARLLLLRDVDRVLQRAADTWDWVMSAR